jgi:hypothetical protein
MISFLKYDKRPQTSLPNLCAEKGKQYITRDMGGQSAQNRHLEYRAEGAQ